MCTPLSWAHQDTNTPLPLDTPTPTATAADGTHPTGMHSCVISIWWIQGAAREAAPPTTRPRSNFFHFSAYGQIIDWRLHLWGWRSPVWKTLDPPLISVKFRTIDFNSGFINLLIRFYFKYIFTNIEYIACCQLHCTLICTLVQ